MSRLKNNRPFDSEAMVEVIVELLVTSLRCAAQLDPELDVGDAIATLATGLTAELPETSPRSPA
jgi:hypothetical protein